MLSTKHLINSRKDVPDAWVFQHYCKINERLVGQDVKMKSIFNNNDKTPSMYVYTSKKDNCYYFKDFSTGKGGNATKLVQEIYNEEFQKACSRIVKDYIVYVQSNGQASTAEPSTYKSKYQVSSYETRFWTSRDATYWQQYGIHSRMLERYNIKPLKCYKMTRVDENGEEEVIEISNVLIYGYFRKDGVLCKIYQPNTKTHKFIKVRDYLQGSDQLSNKQTLIICSSLKDGLTLKCMGANVDILVPDSENTLLKEEIIKNLKTRYDKILTIFDNDDAGISAMKKYKEVYNIDYVYFNIEKDIADAVKVKGQLFVKERLIRAIDKKINHQYDKEESC